MTQVPGTLPDGATASGTAWSVLADPAVSPARLLLIAEEGSLENVPNGIEVVWVKPGKPMPLVVPRA